MSFNKLALILVILFCFIAFTSCESNNTQSVSSSRNNSSSSNDSFEVKVEELPSIKKLLPDNLSEEREKDITHIVVHFMSNVMEKPDSPYEVEDMIKIFNENGISTHYLIDRDGNIIKCVEENRVAYHAGKGTLNDNPDYENKLNRYSIGIEIMAIGSEKDMEQYFTQEEYAKIDKSLIGFTDAQYASLEKLLRNICDRYYTLSYDRQHIIGHSEYNPTKSDPGELFDWSKIGL